MCALDLKDYDFVQDVVVQPEDLAQRHSFDPSKQ